jgi:hypothetical protein
MIMALMLPLLLQATPAPVDDGRTIVVTGRRLADTERALKACLARKCPPKEDITATLAHAEAQFLEGAYPEARQTLGASRGRNARYAKELPVEVANLTRAYARLTSLDGRGDLSRTIGLDTLDALKAGLPANDPRVLMERLEAGDQYAKLGRIEAAVEVYDTVERQARTAALPIVEGHAMLRAAVLYGAAAGIEHAYRSESRKRIARIEKTTDPALAPFRNAAVLLKAQLAAYDGDKTAIDKAVANVRATPAARPVLIHAPAIDDEEVLADRPLAQKSGGSDKAQWVDVSFWITPNGSVRDIQQLRESDNLSGDWPVRAQRALAKRRYAPLALDPASPGVLRVERYSRINEAEAFTGSRIAGRNSEHRIEILDLTMDPPPPS